MVAGAPPPSAGTGSHEQQDGHDKVTGGQSKKPGKKQKKRNEAEDQARFEELAEVRANSAWQCHDSHSASLTRNNLSS